MKKLCSKLEKQRLPFIFNMNHEKPSLIIANLFMYPILMPLYYVGDLIDYFDYLEAKRVLRNGQNNSYTNKKRNAIDCWKRTPHFRFP